MFKVFSSKYLITIIIIAICLMVINNKESTTITDGYSWMSYNKDKTNQWLDIKTRYSKKIMSSFPWRKSIDESFNSYVDSQPTISNISYAGSNEFYTRSSSEYPYQRLYVKGKEGKEKVIIDPPPGYGLNYFSPSHDGRFVAYGLSKNGYEETEIKILDISNGQVISDGIENIRFPHVVWDLDNKSFFYTKRNSLKINKKISCDVIYRHIIGSNLDIKVFDYNNLNKNEYHNCGNMNLYSSLNSKYLIASVSSSISGYSSSIYLSKRNKSDGQRYIWTKIVGENDKISRFIFSGKWMYIAKVNIHSGYDVYRMDLDAPHSKNRKIISWENGDLTGFSTSNDSLYISYHSNSKQKFIRIAFDNIDRIENIPMSFDGEVSAIFSNENRSEILFTLQGWLNPPAIYKYKPKEDVAVDTNFIKPKLYNISNYIAEEIWVKSTGNVKVPLTIIHRKGIPLDGSSPTWLRAYGAYGISSFPHFYPSSLVWLERGGVIAIAHVRGGGELGPSWHDAGRAPKKENSINDFVNCAKYLINNKYTVPSKLVISGVSAGGIVIGMAITKWPDLFVGAFIDAGLLNMSKLGEIPIGPLNYKEFGTPNTKEGLKRLKNIDAYLHIKDGLKYPHVLLTVGLKDQRVSPWQTAKFAARLEEVNHGDNSRVLVLADKESGHYASTYDEANKKFLNMISFFIWVTNSK